ncbi:hypothetical protein GCM10028789_15470 [Sinomonas halotolerans]
MRSCVARDAGTSVDPKTGRVRAALRPSDAVAAAPSVERPAGGADCPGAVCTGADCTGAVWPDAVRAPALLGVVSALLWGPALLWAAALL